MSMLEAALGYEARGWSVIPVTPGKKKPPLVKWEPYIEKRATVNQIKEWWGKWPNANIGLVTGPVSGICVVDVDAGGDPSPIYEEAPCNQIQKTPNGWHLLYKHPGHAVLTRAGVMPNIDVRGDGGYIVAEPSAVEGKSYRWISECSNERLTPPPVFLGGTLTNTEERYQEHLAKEGSNTKWISEMLEGAVEGTRNQAAARLAGYMASKGVPSDVTGKLLVAWNEGKNENPESMPEREILRTVDSVYSRQMREKGPNGIEVPNAFSTVPLYDYMGKFSKDEDEQWLIEDWLPTASIIFQVAPPGAYKTWMLLDAMLSIASGESFFGKWPVQNPGPVVLIQQEDDHADLTRRIMELAWTKFNMGKMKTDGESFEITTFPRDLPVHIHTDRALRFDNAQMVNSFLDEMRRIHPVAIFIDPLYSAVSVDNYMSKAAEQMLVLKSLRDELGTSFLIAHHTRKGDKKEDRVVDSLDRQDAWGSQFLNAFQEGSWHTRSTGPSTFKALRRFKTAGEYPEIEMDLGFGEERVEVEVKRDNVSQHAKSEYDRVLDGVRFNQPVSTNKLQSKLRMNKNKLIAVLNSLQLMGSIERTQRGWTAIEITSEEGDTMQESLPIDSQ